MPFPEAELGAAAPRAGRRLSRLRPTLRDRLAAAAFTALTLAALGTALIAGLAVSIERGGQPALIAFIASPPPPPPPQPPPAPKPAPAPRPEGAAAPPALKAKATEVVAPRPIVPIELPPPVVAAPVPDLGRDAATGNGAVPGPGPGSGGIGTGSGSGGAGTGPGGGGGTPPRHIAGRITNRDYPKAAGAAGIGGTVGVLYVVTVDGRATDCEITRSSGSALLDDTTCRLIEQRFRFTPSRDAAGNPVESMIEEKHSWIVQ